MKSFNHQPLCQSREATAFHEAGHAVADQLGGLVVGEVSITPGDGKLGAAQPGYGWDDEDSARAYVISCLAGYAAEAKHGQDVQVVRDGAESDFLEARRVIELLGGSESHWIAEAEQFVVRHWNAVTAIATELLAHDRLSGDEVEIIVAAAEGDPDADIELYRALNA